MNYTNDELQELYNSQQTIDRGFFHESVSMSDISQSFHPKNCRLHIENDEYFCGLRADTFVVIEGYCEWEHYDVILVLANHKGTLGYVMLKGYESIDVWLK